MSSHTDISGLITRLKQGDKTALKSLYDDYYSILCSQVYRMIRDQGQTEDVVQELFIDLWNKRENLSDIQHLGAYLKRAARNRTLNVIRAQKIKWDDLDHSMELVDRSPTAQESLQEKELKEQISVAIDNLPDRCRQIFVLSRWEQMSYKEIAAQLDISIKTVENQMSKALKVLRTQLKRP